MGGGAGSSGGRPGSGEACFFAAEDFFVVWLFLGASPPSMLDAEAEDVKTKEATRPTTNMHRRMIGSGMNEAPRYLTGGCLFWLLSS